MKLPPGTVVDRYTIEAVLGEGGMAVVYRARHNQLGSLHALKVLKLPTAAIQDRLLQEGRAQAQLRHPNIVSVTDVVDVSGSPGLVMEFIAGVALDDFLRSRRLTIEQADDLARGIIEGVAVAHQAGTIHRDLKPGNILLDPSAKRLVPKITDFGLAKLLDAEGRGQTETRSGMAMGTPAYMAPEQIESAKDVDKRADVFSLGAILYELVGGERPFQGDSTLEVLNAVAGGKRRPIEELIPDVPDRIRIAIDGALQVDRDERIANCDALLDVWTGESADGRGVGPWDPDTVSQIGRALAPIQPGAHSDDSDTYYPTQGVVEASQPPPSVLEEVAPTPAPPPEPAPPGLSVGPAWIAAGLGGVAAVLAIVGFATLGSGAGSRASQPTPTAPAPTEVTQALGPELPPPGEVEDTDAEAGSPETHAKVAAAPRPETPEGEGEAEVDEAGEASEVAEVESEGYDPDMPMVDFLSEPAGATVKIDGLEVGTTPLRGYAMPKGRYKVQMLLDGAEITEKVSVGGKRGARRFTWAVEGGSWAQD
ncbi:MAG: protein kinase [Alphaproteobacteria bacterium]|nr:protein kinase [Alphaproteobacteria bacterium]